MRDTHNLSLSREIPELEHRYGDQVHILADPVARTVLARLGSPETRQPRINRWLGQLYDRLLDAVLAREFPFDERSVSSRMEDYHRGVDVEGVFLDPATKVSIAGIARAGTVPGYRCFQRLCELLDPGGVRLDHLFINRRTDAAGKVIGVDCKGTKIGGILDDRFLLLPDPMAATGSTMRYTLDLYQKEVGGALRGALALHLIITPEYLRAVTAAHPELTIYALRVDRGLSDPEILETVPGTHIEQERGLNERDYIVPGMGGLGELTNNAFV